MSRNNSVVMAVTTDLTMDQRVHRVALALHEAGWNVTAMGRRKPDSLPLPEAPYRRKRMCLWFHTGKLFYLHYNLKLFRKLLLMRAGVVIANDLDTLLGAWWACKLSRKKLVYDAHELFTETPELVRRPGTRGVWLRLEKWLVPGLKWFYTVNGSLSRVYEERYGVKAEVIRNLPLKARVIPVRETPGNILLYQGALNEGRGIERMIDAMKDLPGLELWICGNGPVRPSLETLAQASAAKDRIRFFGLIPFDKLQEITTQASLGFSLEQPAGLNYELALPNKLMDYIQCGVPVLVSDFEEMAAVVSTYQTGETIGQDEPLAKRIQSMLGDAAKWKQYHASCLRAAQELNWEKEKQKVVDLLERCRKRTSKNPD